MLLPSTSDLFPDHLPPGLLWVRSRRDPLGLRARERPQQEPMGPQGGALSCSPQSRRPGVTAVVTGLLTAASRPRLHTPSYGGRTCRGAVLPPRHQWGVGRGRDPSLCGCEWGSRAVSRSQMDKVLEPGSEVTAALLGQGPCQEAVPGQPRTSRPRTGPIPAAQGPAWGTGRSGRPSLGPVT